METINYFKIQSFIEVLITDKLKIIFQGRYETKNQVDWMDDYEKNGLKLFNNYKFGSVYDGESIEFKILKTPVDQYDKLQVNLVEEELKFDRDESKLLLSGRVYTFTFQLLSKLLLHSTDLQDKDNTVYIKQNEIINKINEIYLANIKTTKNEYKLNNDLFNQIKYQLIKLMNGLSSSIDGNSEEENMASLSILFGSINLNNNNNNNKKQYQEQQQQHIENQKEYSAIHQEELLEIKRECKSYYKSGKFKKAYKSNKDALSLEYLTCDAKSQLYLNSSRYLYEYHKKCSNKIVKRNQRHPSPNNEEFKLMIKADQHSKLSIINKPTSSNSYHQFGIINSRLSRYSIAIDCFQASLILDPSESNRVLVFPLINEVNKKLSIITRCLKSNGSRDIERESKLILDEVLQFNSLLKSHFKEKLTRDYYKSIFTKIKNSTSNFVHAGLTETKAQHFNLLVEVGNCLTELDELENNSDMDSIRSSKKKKKVLPLNRKQCIEALGRLVYSDCELSIVYQLLYQEAYIGFESYKPIDTQLLLGLLIKMTTLPIPFVSIKSVKLQSEYLYNYNSVIGMERLASFYRHGVYSLDIDMERASYYYKRAITMDKRIDHPNLVELHCTGYSYLALGYQYFEKTLIDNYHGRLTNQIFNKLKDHFKLSRDYWEQGSSIQNSEFQKTSINKLEKLKSILNGTYDNNKEDSSDTSSNSSNSSPSFKPVSSSASASTSSNKSTSSSSTTTTTSRELIDNDRYNPKTTIGQAIYSLINDDLGESGQPLNFLEIKRSGDKGSLYSTLIYGIFTSVNSFIKSFESYQKQPTVTDDIEDRIQLIKPLADIYAKSPELYYSVRLPKKITSDLKSFIEQLLKRESSNPIVKLCYLALFRFDQDKIEKLLEISKSSAPEASGGYPDREFLGSYHQAFAYYYVNFLVYNYQIQDALNAAIIYAREFKNSSYWFNYYVLKILFSMDPKSEIVKQNYITPELFVELVNRGKGQVNQLTNDNPISCFYNYLIANWTLAFIPNKIMCRECYNDQSLQNALISEDQFLPWLTKSHQSYLSTLKMFALSILGCLCCFKSRNNNNNNQQDSNNHQDNNSHHQDNNNHYQDNNNHHHHQNNRHKKHNNNNNNNHSHTHN